MAARNWMAGWVATAGRQAEAERGRVVCCVVVVVVQAWCATSTAC